MMTEVRTLIVEDDPAVRKHVETVLSGLDQISVIGSVGELSRCSELKDQVIDLALLDIGLPDGSGLDLIAPLRAANADIRILIFTVLGDRQTVVASLEAGADGFVLKDSSPEDLSRAIADVLQGGAPISARAAAYLLSDYRSTAVREDEKPKLSPRELELLELLARGFTYKQAARRMDIHPGTVSEYAVSLYRKLAVNSRGEAVFEAIQNGLIKI